MKADVKFITVIFFIADPVYMTSAPPPYPGIGGYTQPTAAGNYFYLLVY